MLRSLRRMYSNFRTFDKLDELNTHLEKLRHPHVVVYFRANWNPNCEETDKHALQLAADNYHLHVIKIDTDIAPKIAHVYAVTAEPQFVFCLYGDEVLRQIGPNYAGILDKAEKFVKLGEEADWDDIKQHQRWMPFNSARARSYWQQVVNYKYSHNVSSFPKS